MLTPTGYIAESDIDSLEAVLHAAPALNAQAVVSLPLDITWATSEWVDVLIDLAAATPAPKAIMLTGLPRDPVSAKEILANLRLVASQVPQVAFFRSGLGALDLMAHGALAGSIGTSSVTRRLIPPDPRRLPGENPNEEDAAAPQVLVPDLVSYLPGDVLAAQFAGTAVPCWCRYCAGQSLGRFTERAHWRDARLHGFATWTEWLPSLLSNASPHRTPGGLDQTVPARPRSPRPVRRRGRRRDQADARPAPDVLGTRGTPLASRGGRAAAKPQTGRQRLTQPAAATSDRRTP